MDHAYAGPITNLNKRSTASHNNIRNHKNKSTDKQEEKKQIKNKRKRGRRRRRRRRREKASLCKTKPQAAGLATVAWRKMDQQEVNVVLQKGRTAKKKNDKSSLPGQILVTNHDKFDPESKGNSSHKPPPRPTSPWDHNSRILCNIIYSYIYIYI